MRNVIVDAVAGVVGSMVALLNPAGVVVGGPWSGCADFADRLADRVAELAVLPTQVRLAELGTTAPLTGARLAAVRAAQDSLLGPLAKEIAS
jgi:predicted NBD/HSP70 family sugar kinase